MNMQAVEKRMEDKNISIPEMAKQLGINPSTYYRKRKKNGDGFSALDLMVFQRVLEMSKQEAVDILLS